MIMSAQPATGSLLGNVIALGTWELMRDHAIWMASNDTLIRLIFRTWFAS